MSTQPAPTECQLKPVPALEGLNPYRVPVRPREVDLRLDGNEGLVPPVDLPELAGKLGPSVLHAYPSTRKLETQLANRWSINTDRVIVTAGGDDALDRMCRAMLGPDREFILPLPTFEMLERYALLAQAPTINIPWLENPFPVDEIIQAVTPRSAVIAVVSPNNPTGSIATPEQIEAVAEAAPHALVIADLAYIEFADEDPTERLLKQPNVIVVRTLSKAWGMAGLRIGYALGPAEVITWMRTTGGPYPTSGVGLAMAGVWLDQGAATMKSFVMRVQKHRKELVSLLALLGAKPWTSHANFVLARFRDAARVHTLLADVGIAVRAFPNNKDLSSCLRITCPGYEEQFERLTAALREIAKLEGAAF